MKKGDQGKQQGAEGSGKGNEKAFKKLTKKFDDQHVKGEHHPDKKYNHVVDLKGKTAHPIKKAKDKEAGHAKGTIPGQEKAAVKGVDYRETGKAQQGQEGNADFIFTGSFKKKLMVEEKEELKSKEEQVKEKKFNPHHMDGIARTETIEEDGKTKKQYMDPHEELYIDCSTCSSVEISSSQSEEENKPKKK